MDRNFTIFAPVDTAFRRLTTDHRNFLTIPENMERLLLFHICPGRIYTNLFIQKRNLTTMLKGSVINLKTSFNTQSLQSVRLYYLKILYYLKSVFYYFNFFLQALATCIETLDRYKKSFL